MDKHVHHWKIEDDSNFHQIGKCKCGVQKDFGLNSTIVTDKVIITTRYILHSCSKQLLELPHLEEREYRYPGSDLTKNDWTTDEVDYLFHKVDGLVYFYK